MRDSPTFYRALAVFGIAAACAFAAADAAWAAKPAKKPAARTAAKPKAPPPATDPATELKQIGDALVPIRNALAGRYDDEKARQELVGVTLRAVRGAERAVSRGDGELFDAYRELIETRVADTRDSLAPFSGGGTGAADFALGVLALHGILGPRDEDEACRRFAAAMARGFGGSRFRHAQCIAGSEPERALTLLREAAEAGHVAAMEQIGRFCLDASPPEATCAYANLERAAREGRPSAKALLAWMHAEGIGGRQDDVLAARLYAEAAARGEVEAANNLGELLENGRGVGKDPRAAAMHYRRAAEAGSPPAQFNLGRLYAAGKGVDKDVVQAKRWLEEARKAGIEDAAPILEMLEREKE